MFGAWVDADYGFLDFGVTLWNLSDIGDRYVIEGRRQPPGLW